MKFPAILSAVSFLLSVSSPMILAEQKVEVKTLEVLTQAADKGDPAAQFELAVRYGKGDGVQQDYKEAVKWTRKAAEQGHAEAQNQMGGCYLEGKGVDQDSKEALQWFLKAAELGNDLAQMNVVMCYFEGVGVKQDNREGVKWLAKFSEKGNAQAMTRWSIPQSGASSNERVLRLG